MTNKSQLSTYLLLLLILLAFFLRVWRLPQTPPGLWYDEAYYAMDGAWLLDGGPWQIFFAGNNGREPIFIYLQALFIWLYGATPLTARLVAPLVGTLTIPLLYVLARRIPGQNKVVALVAAAGLTISFWHIGLSRGGYRGILLPLTVTLLFYLFWRGWQTKSVKVMLLAGVTLGISQYTYLAARALPLVFAAFALLWTFVAWRNRRRLVTPPGLSSRTAVIQLGVALIVMAVTSSLIFLPLGWIFINDPDLFSARTGDVLFAPDSPAELVLHLSQAIRLFIDNGDPNWRHHLPGRPMLGWLGWLGFWPGLIICLRRWRQAPYLFLLVALLTLYLPALLSTPPVHALRLSSLLPIYYLIFATGLAALSTWLATFYRLRATSGVPRSTTNGLRFAASLIGVILLLELTFTSYDYFGRWAVAEETYVEYNTPLVDFVQHVSDLTKDGPVIIPFQVYVHPTTRYLLHDQFSEQLAPETLTGPVQLVTLPDNFRLLNVANIPELPAYAWLERDVQGKGLVYISRPPREAEQAYLRGEALKTTPRSYVDRFGRELAQIRTLSDPNPLLPMFTQTAPLRSIDLTWDNQAQLLGYELTPQPVRANQPLTLNLYWHSLTNKTFDARLFLQLVDTKGDPITQWEGEAYREDMYRWRPNAILPSQHTLWLGPETPPGSYLVRIGFFDSTSGERLPVTSGSAAQAVDQVHLGLFYVAKDDVTPPPATTPLKATFMDPTRTAEVIRLNGVTLPALPVTTSTHLPVTFYWQSLQPTSSPQTVFLQLLNEDGAVVSGWDRQPFNGLYPTTLWSPGETLTDTLHLPLPAEGLPSGNYRLITGFYDVTTGQRLPLDNSSDTVELLNFKFVTP